MHLGKCCVFLQDYQAYLSLQPLSELSAYIDYARSNISPIITEEAGEELVESYVEMSKYRRMILVQLRNALQQRHVN